MNEERTRKKIEQKTVMGRSVGKLMKTVATRFLGMSMCICMVIPNLFTRRISKLD